jgi:MFS superfamily sulfate permease-like transporter
MGSRVGRPRKESAALEPDKEVYLLSYYEDRGFIEASLGGKVTLGELEVFQEELFMLVDGLEGRPYHLMLDYSRATGLDAAASDRLSDLRAKCHEAGAQRIVCVVPGQADLERETAHHLEAVMNGYQDFVLDPAYARFAPLANTAVVRRVA